jgi:hypothetical protein
MAAAPNTTASAACTKQTTPPSIDLLVLHQGMNPPSPSPAASEKPCPSLSSSSDDESYSQMKRLFAHQPDYIISPPTDTSTSGNVFYTVTSFISTQQVNIFANQRAVQQSFVALTPASQLALVRHTAVCHMASLIYSLNVH